MNRRVTMADVAEQAGVSMMTVSRVINNKDGVSYATRERVQHTIDQLGYRPSSIARSLATQSTGTIGIVVPDITNPYFAGIVRGTEDQAYEHGYNLFLCNTNEDPQREEAILQSLYEKQVDGLILCASRIESDLLERYIDQFSSVVLALRQLDDHSFGSVIVDDIFGGQAVTQHLLRGGHRNIGFIAGPESSYGGQGRIEGYYRVLQAAGIPYRPEWVPHTGANTENGYRSAYTLLQSYPEITALICFNDLMAVGALQAGQKLKRRIPDDLAIIGFDDIPVAALVTPPLTTCGTDRRLIGQEAIRLLMNQIQGREDEPPSVTIQPDLVVRESAP